VSLAASGGRAYGSRMTLRFVLGAGLLVLVLHQAALMLLMASGLPPRASIAMATLLFLLYPLWRIVRIAGVPVRAALGWQAPSPGPTLLAVLGFLAAIPAVLAVTERLVAVPGTLERFFGELLRAGSPGEWVVVLAVAAIVPAVAEESLFRGFLLRGLTPRWGRWGAIAGTSVAFGLIHGLVRAPTAAVLGALLAWIAVRSGSSVPSMLAHVLANAAAVGAANGAALPGAGPSPVPWGVAASAATVSAGLLFLFARSTRRNDPTPPAEEAPWSPPREPGGDRPAPE